MSFNKLRDHLSIEGGINPGTTAGINTAYTLSLPDVTRNTLVDKTSFTVEFHTNSGISPTLDINGTGAIPLLKTDGTAIAAGELLTTGQYIIIYDGTNYVVANPEAASGGALYIDLTRAAALALIAGNTVSIGQNYRITDRRNCMLVGAGTNDFAMEGNMRITALEFFNTNEEFLDVKYDIVVDEIQRYKDVRGNRLKSPITFGNLSAFLTSVRYGDLNKTENEYKGTGLTFTAGDTINYSIFDFGATVSNSGAVTMNDTYVNSFLITTGTPTIQSCRLDNGIQALTVSGTSNLTRCIIDKPALGASITIFNQNHTDKRCVSGFSNFETTLDITGLTTIDLTLRKLHGIVVLTTSNTTETIDLIANSQTNHPVDFVCRTNGKTIIFDTVIQDEVVPIADQIVGKDGEYTIKGSTIIEDIITIRKDIGETVNYVVTCISAGTVDLTAINNQLTNQQQQILRDSKINYWLHNFY